MPVVDLIPEVFSTVEKSERALTPPMIHQRLVTERRVRCELADVEEAVAVLLRVGAFLGGARAARVRAVGTSL